MLVTRLRLRDFRSYERAEVELGPGLTVVHGRNGAGKTNLLEALYFGCTGRSCRTSNEREVVRFDAGTTRVEVDLRDAEGRAHALAVGFTPGEAKRLQADGAPVERLVDVEMRPLVCVFMPDRLELIKGPPALRRSHIDQVIAASWPVRAATRRAYSRALAQRNALLAGIRSGRSSRGSLPAWDAELARHGIALRDDRAAVVDAARAALRAPGRRARPRAAAPSCATGRARAPPTRPSWPPSSPSASSPTSSAASPATARTATTSRCCATGASCAPTARRASSAWRCWRCCSPSARRWPRRATRCRSCCSTTS